MLTGMVLLYLGPRVCAEMLIYDCRLMNTAHNLHESKVLRKLFVESDRYRDPQALFLDPEVYFSLAKVIVSESDDYRRTLRTAVFACNTMREAIRKNFHYRESLQVLTLTDYHDGFLGLSEFLYHRIRTRSFLPAFGAS